MIVFEFKSSEYKNGARQASYQRALNSDYSLVPTGITNLVVEKLLDTDNASNNTTTIYFLGLMTNDTTSSDTKRHATNDDRGDGSAAARSAVETETVTCGQSKSDCRQTDPIFTKGQTVYYKSTQGFAEEALILEVNVDDLLVPYYTIRLLNGEREKQTYGARISTLSDLCKSPKSNLIENLQSPATPLRPLRSILRPSSYGRNRIVITVTPDCKGDDGYTMPPSSKNFLQSIEKKLSERKIRGMRAAQVVTPDCECQTNHRPKLTPKQLFYSSASNRKRKRPDDDDDDKDETRERKRRRLAIVEVESSATGEDDTLPFHFMPRTSKLSSSTWDINVDSSRTYPDILSNVPLDWPINGGGYYPISFHDKHSQRDESHFTEYQMFLFDEILSKLENDATEESARTGTSISARASMPSLLSPVTTFISSFSAKCLSNPWGYIRSKLSFGGASVKQTLEVIASDTDQTCSKAAADDDGDDVAESKSTSVLHANVTRHEKLISSPTQNADSPQNVASKPLSPRPPGRWKDAFAIKDGHWKCKSCFHQNPTKAMTCDVCTALRDDLRVSNDVQSTDVTSDAQSTDAQTSDDQSDSPQSDGSQTEDSATDFSGTDDSYTDDDTETTSYTQADDDTETTSDAETDVSQADDSVKSSEDNRNSTKASKKEDSNTSPNVTANNQGRRLSSLALAVNNGRRLSSLALAVERIRADRARNAAFNAHRNASEQPSSSDDVASETNRSKRFRGARGMELVEDDSTGAVAERDTGSTVGEQLGVVDLDVDPFLGAPLETTDVESVESMSVTSNMSVVVTREMMELDGALHNKRGSNEFTSNGKKKKRFG